MTCLIYNSAAAVISNGEPIQESDERVPVPRHLFGDYARTKAIGERIVIEANDDHLRTIAARSPAIWGVGENNLLPKIADPVGKRQFVWINGGRYPYDTSHVRNVCQGAILASENGRGREDYFLTHTQKIAFREFVTGLLNTQNLTTGALSVPRFIYWSSAAFLEIF